MEANYPYAIKNQREASKIPMGALDARAGSLWPKTAGEAIPQNNPRYRGGPL